MASAEAWADASMDANTAFGNWLAYQAAGFTMLQYWGAATRQARQAELNGTWDWSSRPPEPFQCDWSAFLKSDGTFVFVGLDASPGDFPRLPLPNKVAREYALRIAQYKAWQEVLAACTGPCLTWAPEEGWFVTQSAQPAQGDWRRHQLLGLAGAKQEFWLFGAGELFAARLCNARLQAFGATPRDAIAALRKWLPAYLRMSQGSLPAPDGGKNASGRVPSCSSLT